MFEFLLFFTLIILFIVPLVSLLFLRKDGRSILSPFLMGVLVYLIGIKGLNALVYRLLSYLPGDSTVLWRNNWFYGIFTSLIVAVCTELVRFFILWLRNSKKHWSSSRRRNAVMGIGEGWITGICTWGYFIAEVAFNLVTGKDISHYGLDAQYVGIMLVQKIIMIFMCIALTFVAQFGVRTRKVQLYMGMCIFIHTIAEMGLFFIPYHFNLPMFVAEIFYAILTALAFAYGYVLIKSLHSRKKRKTPTA